MQHALPDHPTGTVLEGRYELGPRIARGGTATVYRALDTRLGTLQLRIPKLRSGPAYFPPFLEPRKTSEKALVAVIQEAWIGGVSTRRVDELVQTMGFSGIGKSTVSKLCKDIDERVNAFPDRPLSRSDPSRRAEPRRRFRGASGRTCGWTRRT